MDRWRVSVSSSDPLFSHRHLHLIPLLASFSASSPCLSYLLPPLSLPVSQPEKASLTRAKGFAAKWVPAHWTEHERWRWIDSDSCQRVLLDRSLPPAKPRLFLYAHVFVCECMKQTKKTFPLFLTLLFSILFLPSCFPSCLPTLPFSPSAAPLLCCDSNVDTKELCGK